VADFMLTENDLVVEETQFKSNEYCFDDWYQHSMILYGR
jgi:hypothetical protein